MVVKDRRGGTRNWVPGLFAAFWILLAAFSGAYLFRIVTDPAAHRAVTALASPDGVPNFERPDSTAAAPANAPSPLSAEQADALLHANEAKDRELAELKTALRELSGQVDDLNTRFKPLEKVLGPVAALPTSTSVTTSPPSPEPMRPPEKPPEPPKPEAKTPAPKEPAKAADLGKAEKPTEKPSDQVKVMEKPSVSEKPAEKPSDHAKTMEKPSGSAKPAEKPSAQAKAPEQPSDQDAADEAPSAPAAETPTNRTKPPEKPSEQASATLGSKDQKPGEKPAGAVQVTSNEPASTPSASSTETPNVSAPPPIPPGTTRFGIEIGSVEKQEGVRPMWRDLLTNHAALVAGLQARRIIAPDKKWRLIAGPFSSAAEAMQACALFKKANMPCEATVFAGDSL